ncbi:hypothetical protein [Burkholderia ubonensis]|uniref:hypothetical protein n=2 Tax=Burkholderia ubonensis TaxID=101571 RepID=UPI0018E02CB3|nr:hypothetical protein [Burkholderia ubonensis]
MSAIAVCARHIVWSELQGKRLRRQDEGQFRRIRKGGCRQEKGKVMKRFLLGWAAAAALMVVGCAGADELRAGVYELRSVPGTQLDYRKVYVAVDKGAVTGYFDNPFTAPAVNNPDRDPTCRFLLKGEAEKGGAVGLATYFAGERGGRISVSLGDRGVWNVRVDGDLPNCEVPTIESGDFLTFKASRNWIGFATVASKRAPLSMAAQDSARSKAYVVNGDVVAVLVRQGDRVQIDYFARGSDVVRWIKRSDLRDD